MRERKDYYIALLDRALGDKGYTAAVSDNGSLDKIVQGAYVDLVKIPGCLDLEEYREVVTLAGQICQRSNMQKLCGYLVEPTIVESFGS